MGDGCGLSGAGQNRPRRRPRTRPRKSEILKGSRTIREDTADCSHRDLLGMILKSVFPLTCVCLLIKKPHSVLLSYRMEPSTSR
jgi:hypothetical protein